MTPAKLLSLFFSLCLILEQNVFAQMIDLSHYFVRDSSQAIPQSDKFRPLHLRYLGYDSLNNDFKLLLDKGDIKKEDLENKAYLEENTQTLLKYFFIGLVLPNDKFWVNLRPDSPDNILDPDLEKTDIGRIFLEADLQLKKDTAGMTSPQTPEGKAYWDKLYKKAGELFGTENITIPTITRPWIVPNEIIIREAPDNAYIYKATLKVMLEEDYLNQKTEKLKNPKTEIYNFSDPRFKELNQYSTQLIKEAIIPKLTYEVNTSKRYAPLRQVYYSLILAQWFKEKYGSQSLASGLRSEGNPYIKLIDSGKLTWDSHDNNSALITPNFSLLSQQPYDKQVYFQQYQKSFQDGEYNLQEPVYTPMGQSIRRHMSGGAYFGKIISFTVVSSAVDPPAMSQYLLPVNLGKPHVLATDIKLSAEEIRQVKSFIAKISEGKLFLENIMEEWRLQALLAKYLKTLQAEKRVLYGKLNKGGEEAYSQYVDRYLEISELILLSEFYIGNFLLSSQHSAYARAAKILKEILEKVEIKGTYYLVVPKSLPYLGFYLTMANSSYIIISEDMISALDDDALAWVIGHELAHCTSGHSKQHLKAMALHGDFSPDNVDYWSGFIQSHEKEADSLGVDLSTKAGYRGIGAIRALEISKSLVEEAGSFIKDIVGEEGAGLVNNEAGLRVETHVSLEQRIRDLQPIIARIVDAKAKTNQEMSSVGQSISGKEEGERPKGAVSGIGGSVSSPLPQEAKVPGGIDFRALPIVTRAITNLGADISSSRLSRLRDMSLNQEWQQIENMAKAGIAVSPARIKGYLQASSVLNDDLSKDREKVIILISNILRQEEGNGYKLTNPALRDILVVLDAMSQTSDLKQVFLGKNNV